MKWLDTFPSTNAKAAATILFAAAVTGTMCYVMGARESISVEMAWAASVFVSSLWAGAVVQFIKKRETEKVTPPTVMAKDAGDVAVAHEEAAVPMSRARALPERPSVAVPVEAPTIEREPLDPSYRDDVETLPIDRPAPYSGPLAQGEAG